ncbi:MAG: hypothetical protein ACREE4_04425 [Stellaceae bacterium]
MFLLSIIKRYSKWDRKSYREKTIIYYRFKKVFATIVNLIPLPIGILFNLFGTDKEQNGGHHYGATYGTVLRQFRYRPIKLLEIGIGGYDSEIGGGSLLAWQAFFPFAKIVACDIAPKPELSSRRTRIYTIDQSSDADLARLATAEAPFDIIIDDGSHLNEHQVFTFSKLFASLNDSGLYIIEDVQTSFWPPGQVGKLITDGRHIDDPEFSRTCVGYFLDIAKYLNYQEFIDYRSTNEEYVQMVQNIRRISFEHNLIVIEKGQNDAPSNNIFVRNKHARQSDRV